MPAKLPTPPRRDPPLPLSGEDWLRAPYAQRSEAIWRARVEWERALVLSLAMEIEPDADAALRWFVGDCIRELGDKTAAQLVEEGATAHLLRLMAAIRSGQRDS